MTIKEKPFMFCFDEITKSQQKEQTGSSGFINSAMQGYLAKQQPGGWKSMFGSAKWDSDFYVLTNIGVLVFKDDNFLNPLTLYPLAMIKIEQMLGKKIGGKEHIFKLFVGGD